MSGVFGGPVGDATIASGGDFNDWIKGQMAATAAAAPFMGGGLAGGAAAPAAGAAPAFGSSTLGGASQSPSFLSAPASSSMSPSFMNSMASPGGDYSLMAAKSPAALASGAGAGAGEASSFASDALPWLQAGGAVTGGVAHLNQPMQGISTGQSPGKIETPNLGPQGNSLGQAQPLQTNNDYLMQLLASMSSGRKN